MKRYLQEEIDEKEQHQDNNIQIKSVVLNPDGLIQGITSKNNAVNAELGVTNVYNKDNRAKYWDSTKGKVAYKEQVFGDKKTTRLSDGTLVHKNTTAARNKYQRGSNSNTWAKHAAETDHIVSIKQIHERVKENPFLTNQDVREIANRDANYQVLSKKDNTSKGACSEWEVLTNVDNELTLGERLQRGGRALGAETVVNADIALRTAKNVGAEFMEGAKHSIQGATTMLATQVAYNVVSVLQGDRSPEEAIKETTGTIGVVAVIGGTERVIRVAAPQLAKKITVVLRKASVPLMVAQVAWGLRHSAEKLINDRVTVTEFIQDVTVTISSMLAGEMGAQYGGMIGTVAGPVGTVVGALIGAIVGSLSIGLVGEAFLEGRELKKVYKKKEALKKAIWEETRKTLEVKGQQYKQLVERELIKFDTTMYQGFSKLFAGGIVTETDFDTIVGGLEQISQYWGETILFKNIEEYKLQLDKPLVLKF